MKAKTDWKTIAQPWILGCLFPLSWRSKRKIILKERLKSASSLSITQKMPFKPRPGGSSRAQVLVGGFSAVLQLHFSIPHLPMPMPIPTRLRVQQLLVAGGTWRSRAHGAGTQRSNPVALSAAATLNFICTSPIFGLELSQLFPLAVHS